MRSALRVLAVVALVLASMGLDAEPAAAYSGIKLPYPNGLSYRVEQGPGGCGSHCVQPDYWGWDFAIPTGSLVSAVKHGTVIRSFFGSNEGGCSQGFANLANYVVLDHGDGYSSIYWHLQYNSQQVPQWTFVYQGRPLGGADTTGWACGTHLHFAIEPTPPDGVNITNSVQVFFDEVGEPGIGSYPVSQNRKQFSADFISQSPWPTLSAGQVTQLVGQWRNIGWDKWIFSDPTHSARIGTNNPIPGMDQPSLLGGGPGCSVVTDWLSCNRVRMTTAQVDPDQDGWFAFNVRGPSAPGTYDLHMRPVIDGVTWMEDEGVFWRVTRP